MRDLSYGERLGREAVCLKSHWDTSPRWRGIERTYTADDVIGLRGTITIEHTLARLGRTGCGRSWGGRPSSPRSAR